MNIKQWFFDKFKAITPQGEIEAPAIKPKEINRGLHHMIKVHIGDISRAIYQLNKINDLLAAPRVAYVKGVHTKGTMEPFKGLGVISVIYDSETGKALFAELKECE